MAKSKKEPLIIHELLVRNIGPIKKVHIIPKGDVVELSGPNGAGKSSLLDSISYALSGARSFTDIPKVVRRGQEEAEILVDLGQYKVIREWSGEHNYRLKVMAKLPDGEETQVSAPQSVLDTFGKTIGVDPLELSDKRNTELRKEFLESFVDIDLDKLDHEYKETYEKRTQVNRDVKNAKARKDGLDPVPEELPEKVDVSEESDKLQQAQQHNSKVERAKEKRDGLVDKLDEQKAHVKDLERQLQAAKEDVTLTEDKINKAEEWIDENQPIDTEPIKEKITKAEEISEKHQLATRHKELEKEIISGENKSNELTAELMQIENKKVEAIKGAKMPLEGLNIEEADITIDGQAFLQYSEGERLRFAALMIVGSNPRFRVIPIKEGEKLDSKNMATLKEVCQKHGFQLWIEKMDETGDVGFVFEAGEIVKNNQKS